MTMHRARQNVCRRGLKLIGFAAACAPAFAQTGNPPPAVTIDANGDVHVPAHVVPMSSMLSPEGKAYVTEHLINMQRPAMLVQEDGIPPLLAGYLEAAARSVSRRAQRHHDRRRARVRVLAEGAASRRANRNRVLIDLHGGGFSGCWPGCAELESIPVAALGRIRVLSLDYRQGPKYQVSGGERRRRVRVSRAARDVQAREHRHLRMLGRRHADGQAVAWFQQHSCRGPARSRYLCAGHDGCIERLRRRRGVHDRRDRREPRRRRRRRAARRSAASPLGYFAGTALDDPLVAPAARRERAREIPADVDRDGHARIRAELRRAHACAAREAGRRRRSARMGRHVSRVLLQRRRTGVPRLLRRDREVLRPPSRMPGGGSPGDERTW